MSRTRIVYTIPNFKTAGSQHVVLSLYRRVDRFLFDPYICVEKYPEKIPEDVPMDRRLVFEWGGNAFEDVRNFSYLLSTHKIDIVHSWDYKSNYLEPLASKIAGVSYLYTKKNSSWSKRWILKSFLSDHIAYDNPEMKESFFSSRIYKKKITFVPHGVDTNVFKPLEKIPTEFFNLVCIGNIENNKNQLFIIKALKDLPDNFILHLYGKEDSDYKKLLEQYILSTNLGKRIQFHGYIDNSRLPEIFRKIDVFVLASKKEGMPVSIMESLACGIPILCSDSGGGAKFVLSGGGGYIFDLANVRMMINHLERLAQNPEESILLSLEGRKNIENNLSVQKEISSYEKLYLMVK